MKRTSLTTLTRTIKAASKAPAQRPMEKGRTIITAINLPAASLELIRHVAVKRATTAGSGRPSVSAVLVDLIERHRKDLEAELR